MRKVERVRHTASTKKCDATVDLKTIENRLKPAKATEDGGRIEEYFEKSCFTKGFIWPKDRK